MYIKPSRISWKKSQKYIKRDMKHIGKSEPTLKTLTRRKVLSTFSGSKDGEPGITSRSHSTVLVITDGNRTFRQYAESMRGDGPNWLRRARYVHVVSAEILRTIPATEAQLRFVGRSWESPMYGHPALRKYPAPLGRHDANFVRRKGRKV